MVKLLIEAKIVKIGEESEVTLSYKDAQELRVGVGDSVSLIVEYTKIIDGGWDEEPQAGKSVYM